MTRLKSPSDLDGIRASARILSDTFVELRTHLLPGVTTGDLDRIATEYIRRRGGVPAFLDYPGPPGVAPFPACLCISVNDEVIHGIPGRRRLESGDLVSLDCGVDLDGYFSDAAVTVGIGEIDPDDRALIDTTRQCLDEAINAARTGRRIRDISRAVYDLATERGYGVVRQFCGHGVGFSQHEEPQVPNYPSSGENPRLKPGMVLAVEPMLCAAGWEVEILEDGWTVVTVDRAPAAHFEHTIAILDGRVEVLTEHD